MNCVGFDKTILSQTNLYSINTAILVTTPIAENTYWRGRLSTVDLLIKTACFVKKEKNHLLQQLIWIRLDSARRWTVLMLPLQWEFLVQGKCNGQCLLGDGLAPQLCLLFWSASKPLLLACPHAGNTNWRARLLCWNKGKKCFQYKNELI
jgi:hypothetical protein